MKSPSSSIDSDSFIFVPAYNVGSTLAQVLERIPGRVWEYAQVLVIDDGSQDHTKDAYEQFAGTHKELGERLCYIRFEKNQGYGAVVKKGIAEALACGAKYVACLHGDGQYPADLLDRFFNHLKNFRARDGKPLALLQGSRHAVAGGAKAGHMPLYKRFGGAFLTVLENAVFRQRLTDRHSGYIFYATEFLKTVDLNRLSPSFDIDLELISIADACGWNVGELPIPTVYDGEKSNLNVVTYGFRVLRQVFRRML